MSAWGTGLYSDDTTSEIRDAFKEHLEAGLTHAEASSEILKGYNDVLNEHQIACLVFFALADTQWKYGCLDEAVRSKALTLIESGGDVAYWEESSPRDQKARSSVIDALKKKLLSPQPPLKLVKLKSKRPTRKRIDGPFGSVFAFQLNSDSFALLKYVGEYDMGTWLEPMFFLLPWQGSVVPPGEALEGIAESWVAVDNGCEFGFFFADGRKNPIQRLIPTGIVLSHLTPMKRGSVRLINIEFFAQQAIEAITRHNKESGAAQKCGLAQA